MPSDSSMYVYKPTAVFTGCVCPNVHWGGLHESGCPTQPRPIVKPSPYAAMREWKRYRRLLHKAVR